MTPRLRLLLFGTHVAAMALGVAIALAGAQRDRAEAGGRTPQSAKSSEARGTERRRVTTEDLWAAYSAGSQWSEAQQARRTFFGDLPTPKEKAERKARSSKTPKERAAEVTDFVAAMDAGVREVNDADMGEDYVGEGHLFYEALLERWVNEDPEAAMAWMGRMESKTIWQDVYDGIMAGNLKDDPVRFVELMDRDWLPRNREPLMASLAAHVGKHHVARLPEVLEGLAERRERSGFLTQAAKGADAENVGTWLDILDEEQSPDLARVVVASAFREIGADWEERTQAILAQVEGTAYDEMFRTHWERRSAERDRELEGQRLRALVEGGEARTVGQVAEALEGFVAYYEEGGSDPEQAREQAAAAVRQAADQMGNQALHRDLQAVVYGEMEVGEALSDVQQRLAAYRRSCPGRPCGRLLSMRCWSIRPGRWHGWTSTRPSEHSTTRWIGTSGTCDSTAFSATSSKGCPR